jgi:hypothetical protein
MLITSTKAMILITLFLVAPHREVSFAVAALSPSSFRSNPPLDGSRLTHTATSLPKIGKCAELRDSDLAIQAPEFRGGRFLPPGHNFYLIFLAIRSPRPVRTMK